MPLITVEHLAGQLSPAQKSELAEELTRVLLEIEGGGDTPFGRAGSWVRFRELAHGDWFVGGVNEGTYVSASGLAWWTCSCLKDCSISSACRGPTPR